MSRAQTPAPVTQQLYWLFFQNRAAASAHDVSAATRQNRALLGLPQVQETDQPLAPELKAALHTKATELGIKLRYSSKWLNAVSVEATPTQLEALRQTVPYTAVEPFRRYFYQASTKGSLTDTTYSDALTQMRAATLLRASLTAKGVKMGLIDGGFRDADLHTEISYLFKNGQVKGMRDFVDPAHTAKFTKGKRDSLDAHGTTVLKMVAGRDKEANHWQGGATGAEFWLARTDNAMKEYRAEEDQWLAAVEWMDSAGVRIINSSLGYGKGFDLPAESYKPSQMDGRSTVIARAASIATRKKGIIVIVSAGNEGEDETWKYISSPADVKEVIAVGATWNDAGQKAGYSGIGPGYLSYTKPDVAAHSLTGTSFSAPAIAGLAACLLEANPKLGPAEMQSLLTRSGTLAHAPNNYLGYGVPLMDIALEAARLPEGWKKGPQVPVIRLKAKLGDVLTFGKELPGLSAPAAVFVKKDQRMVIGQYKVAKPQEGSAILKLDPSWKDAAYVTVMTLSGMAEIQIK